MAFSFHIYFFRPVRVIYSLSFGTVSIYSVICELLNRRIRRETRNKDKDWILFILRINFIHCTYQAMSYLFFLLFCATISVCHSMDFCTNTRTINTPKMYNGEKELRKSKKTKNILHKNRKHQHFIIPKFAFFIFALPCYCSAYCIFLCWIYQR